ncbi:MAG TPA: hypothetical protein VIV54_22525 [Burkholderiales bacterium]
MKNAILLLLAFVAAPALAQVDVSLQAGGEKYQASGQGECRSAPRASIYGVPAALYSVAQRAGKQSLNLTLWQPQDGKPVMLSLQLSAGGKRYVVDTVKAGTKTDTKGSGKASIEKSGAGGTIVLDAVAAGGEKITGRIQCRSFGGITAEGG